jgi:antitoxin component YwqK of YwqJK toxin-antitoxin module
MDYYEDGTKQHQVTYENGRKTGEETYWLSNGKIDWTWQRDLKTNRGVWTHYWPNGKKKIESAWNIKPEARDLKRQFIGYVAHGPSKHWDEQGNLTTTHEFVNGILQ